MHIKKGAEKPLFYVHIINFLVIKYKEVI